MKKITIYTKMMCPYCWGAKSLLQDKGKNFEEIDIGRHPEQRSIMIDRASGYRAADFYRGSASGWL